ncbi:MAG: hypothetical protein U9N59_06140 [Campylobacterota bacterium]|nr:hypothetical protein [Campylobacterota bacterium]
MRKFKSIAIKMSVVSIVTLILSGCTTINTVYNPNSKQLKIELNDKYVIANDTEKSKEYSKEPNSVGQFGQELYTGNDICSSIKLIKNKQINNGHYNNNTFFILNKLHKNSCNLEQKDVSGYNMVVCDGNIDFDPYTTLTSLTASVTTDKSGNITYKYKTYYITLDKGSSERPTQSFALGTENLECYNKLKNTLMDK